MDTMINRKSADDMQIEKSKIRLTVSVYLLEFAYGLSVMMIGPLMPAIIEEYKIKLSQGGLLITFHGIGGTLAIIFGGILVDLARKSKLEKIVFGVISAAIIAVSFTFNYPVLLGLFFLLGTSTKMLDIINNAFISDLHPNRRGRFLNLLHTFYAIGAFTGPLFSSTLLDTVNMNWHYIYLFFGGFCVLIWVFYCFVLKGVSEEEESDKPAKTKNLLSIVTSPQIIILGLIVLMYTGYSAGTSTWLPSYMQKFLHVDVFLSSIAVSVFWVGIIAGRFLCSILSDKIDAKHLILFGSLSGSVILIAGIYINTPVSVILAVGLAGFLPAAVIPLSIMIACNSYPQNPGGASSIIFIYNTVAWAVFPWLVGFVAENTDFQQGMALTGVALLAVFLLSLFLRSRKA